MADKQDREKESSLEDKMVDLDTYFYPPIIIYENGENCLHFQIWGTPGLTVEELFKKINLKVKKSKDYSYLQPWTLEKAKEGVATLLKQGLIKEFTDTRDNTKRYCLRACE